MIVELFGPPGVGKTTLAGALADRLRERGHGVKLVLSYRPAEYALASRAEGLARLHIPALRRLVRPLVESFAAAGHSAESREARAAAEMIRLLAPRNIVRSLKLRQYVLRLSRTWGGAALCGDIVLFDQGFIQAVCTFALVARAADPERIALALDAVPEPDLVVRLDAPLSILETRLAERRHRQSKIEQLLDLDAATNLGSVWIFDQMHELLRARGRPVICVDSTDQRSLGKGLEKVERKMRRSPGIEPAGSSARRDGTG
jgi:thymidylate kinase